MTDMVVGGVTSLSDQVAEEIRVLLTRRRMSQRKLALQLQVSPAWLNYRLTGVQPIDLNDLERIAKALGVEVADLIPRAVRTATGGNTLRNHRLAERTNPIVSPPAKDRPTSPTSRPPRGPRRASTAPAPRRPTLLPRPTAA